MTGLIWFGRFAEYFSYKPKKTKKKNCLCKRFDFRA
jgi:hypothetical protein